MTVVLEQALSTDLLYGKLPKPRPWPPADLAPDRAPRHRPWVEGDLAVWRPDATQGTVDVLVRAVDSHSGIAEVLVLTPHIDETNEEIVAPLVELEIKGRSEAVPRADFEAGDPVIWIASKNWVVRCIIVAAPNPDFDWLTVMVPEEQATGLLKSGRYTPHRGSIRFAPDEA